MAICNFIRDILLNTKSFKKSRKLARLQRQICLPDETAGDLMERMRKHEKGVIGWTEQKKELIEEYLDMCVSDTNVKFVLDHYGMDRSDLMEIYKSLIFSLGIYGKSGHYIPLSTISYFEPLVYVVEAKKSGLSQAKINGNLLLYWDDEVPQGGLVNKLQEPRRSNVIELGRSL